MPDPKPPSLGNLAEADQFRTLTVKTYIGNKKKAVWPSTVSVHVHNVPSPLPSRHIHCGLRGPFHGPGHPRVDRTLAIRDPPCLCCFPRIPLAAKTGSSPFLWGLTYLPESVTPFDIGKKA